MSLSPKLEQTLRSIHAGVATNGTHYVNAAHPMVAVLIKSGHVSNDASRVDPNDASRSAVTVTESGHAALGIVPAADPVIPTTDPKENNMSHTETAAVAAKPKRTRTTVVPVVHVADGFMALPDAAPRRGGNRQETYGFGQLQVPQNGQFHSFFVPATNENPEPEKTLRAAVSSANARYKDKGGASFVHRMVNENGVAGVRVFRVK